MHGARNTFIQWTVAVLRIVCHFVPSPFPQRPHADVLRLHIPCPITSIRTPPCDINRQKWKLSIWRWACNDEHIRVNAHSILAQASIINRLRIMAQQQTRLGMYEMKQIEMWFLPHFILCNLLPLASRPFTGDIQVLEHGCVPRDDYSLYQYCFLEKTKVTLLWLWHTVILLRCIEEEIEVETTILIDSFA